METDSLSDPSGPQDLITGIEIDNMECHKKWNVTLNGMSLKMKCHSKKNVTQNEMSLKLNVTQS